MTNDQITLILLLSILFSVAIEEAYAAGYEAAKNENPWRYPSRGELPEEMSKRYQVTWGNGEVAESYGLSIRKLPHLFRAWREIPEPAPELMEEEKK